MGTDGSQLEYVGHSQAIDYLGNYVVEPFENESVKIFSFDKNEMLETRLKLNFLNDKDRFELIS